VIAVYIAEQDWEEWCLEALIAVEARAGRSVRAWAYPDDPRLPGLPLIASLDSASRLLREYAGLQPRHLRVERVRYRAGSRSIVRYVVGYRRADDELHVYARATRPRRIPRLLAAHRLVHASGFVVPAILGAWEDAGIAWLTGAPGATLRSLIHDGTAPPAADVIDAMLPLWTQPPPPADVHALRISRGFEQAHQLFASILTANADCELHHALASALKPFADRWTPTAAAHNDLHDDQLIVTPSGKIALVDFEEAGPGDPLLDIANMLAHLRWMHHFGAGDACTRYRAALLGAAPRIPGFNVEAVAVRESYALFRLASNPVMQAYPNWPHAIREGLALAAAPLAETGQFPRRAIAG
jgi:hypothetical protein